MRGTKRRQPKPSPFPSANGDDPGGLFRPRLLPRPPQPGRPGGASLRLRAGTGTDFFGVRRNFPAFPLLQ